MTATEGSAAAISVRGLRMSYGTCEAVRGSDFDVEPAVRRFSWLPGRR